MQDGRKIVHRSTSLFVVCWNNAKTGRRVGTPLTWQSFVEADASVIFGQFRSISLQKVHPTYIAEAEKKCGPNFILAPSKRVLSRAKSLFSEFNCIFQN